MSTLLWVRSYGYLDKIMSCHRQNLIGEDFLGPRFVSVPPEFTKSIFKKISKKKKKKKKCTYAQTAKHGLTDFAVTKKHFRKIENRYTKKQYSSKGKEFVYNVEVVGYLLCDLCSSFMIRVL